MPASETNLYNLSFVVKKIQFEPVEEIAGGKIAVSVTFLRYSEQTVFISVSSCPGTLCVNAGKSFTFGLGRDTECDLANEFVVNASLDRVDPDERLSSARIDVTKSFRQVFADNCSNNARSQVKTIVHFNDRTGAKIADMELLLSLSPSGQTIVNEFNLDGNVGKQILAVSKGCKCPPVPDFKPLDKEQQQEQGDDDWDIVGAELNNGQKIAVKYQKKYYRIKPPEVDNKCKNPEPKLTRSEERLNAYILKIIEQMHRMVVAINNTSSV